MDNLNTLTAFRQAAHDCFTQAQDALFELTDALMLTPAANSFVELSLSPVFRGKWPSVYEAIADADIDQEALLRLYLAHRPEARALIIDHTAWPRLSARTLPERTFEHHPTKINRESRRTTAPGLWGVARTPGGAARLRIWVCSLC